MPGAAEYSGSGFHLYRLVTIWVWVDVMASENLNSASLPTTDRMATYGDHGAAKEGDCGTLILDELGNILSCGIAAGKLFGGNLSDHMGKPISTLIPGFSLHNTSQSYNARYFAHLCTEGGWRKFDAIDVLGHEFPIEINLSLVESKAQGVFLLNVRRQKMGQ